jgi:hypothetical protein
MRVLDFDAEKLDAAIDAVAEESAAQTERHVEWCRRRIREAVEFVMSNDRSHADYHAHFALAAPVMAACMADGGIVGEHPIH